jgi:hypothetical protein
MSNPVTKFNFIEKVGNIYFQLQNTPYNGFPVFNSKRRPIGIIERDVLITLIKKEVWYHSENIRRNTGEFFPSNQNQQEIDKNDGVMVAINNDHKNSIDSMDNMNDSFREDLLKNTVDDDNDDEIMYPR